MSIIDNTDLKSHINVSDLGDEVASRIRDLIVTGAMGPGDWIRAAELAAMLGVSTTPVREALRRLQAEGLVEFFPRRGPRVVEISLMSWTETLAIRRQLESLACKWIGEDFTRIPLAHLRELMIRLEEAESRHDIPRRMQLVRDFYFSLYKSSARPILVRILSSLWDATAPYRFLFSRLEDTIPERLDHFHSIMEACQDKDETALREAMLGMADFSERRLSPILAEMRDEPKQI